MPAERRLLPYFDEMLTAEEIGERLNISADSVRDRYRRGSSLETPRRAAEKYEYHGKMMTLREIGESLGVTDDVIRHRLRKGQAFDHKPKWRRKRPAAEKLIDNQTPFEEDERCRYVVKHHPDGLTLDEIGQLMDCTRERVRQLESRIIAKLQKRRVTVDDLRAMKECAEALEARRALHPQNNVAIDANVYAIQPTAQPTYPKRRRAS